MQPDAFRNISSWFKEAAGIHEVTLLGGEPTQHPQLSELLDITQAQDITARVCTNGFYSASVGSMLSSHPALRSMLVHYEMTYHGMKGYRNGIERNLAQLVQAQIPEVFLRYNFHLDFQPGDVLSLAKQFNLAIAYSISSPAKGLTEYFRHGDLHAAGERLLAFAQQADEQGTKLILARALPLCMFTEEQRKKFAHVLDLHGTCTAAKDITVNSDLSLQLCSVMKGCRTDPVKSAEDLTVKIDALRKMEADVRKVPSFDACRSCDLTDTCQGGCLSYKAFGDKQ